MEILEKVKTIRESLEEDIKNVTSSKDCQELKVKYFGKKGLVTELTSNMKELSIEEKKEVGRVSNEIKTEVNTKITELEEELKTKELNEKLESERIDLSLPSKKLKRGSRHPFQRIIEDVEDFFVSMGYDVMDGPELETIYLIKKRDG